MNQISAMHGEIADYMNCADEKIRAIIHGRAIDLTVEEWGRFAKELALAIEGLCSDEEAEVEVVAVDPDRRPGE